MFLFGLASRHRAASCRAMCLVSNSQGYDSKVNGS